MKRIEVNNGGFIEMENVAGGLKVASCDHKGYVERRDYFSDGEITMVLNLLRYMKDNDLSRVWLMEKSTEDYLNNLIRNGDMIDFQLFG